MKLVAESKGIEMLRDIRDEFADAIRGGFEHRAKPCSACTNPGVCCRDEHFVNVRITRLEARAILQVLDRLGKRQEVRCRASEAADIYGLRDNEDPSLKAFACPLFEKGPGCLVHDTAKPLPCIAHACYDKREHLPPDHLLEEREDSIARLDRRVYGRESTPLPIPLAIELCDP